MDQPRGRAASGGRRRKDGRARGAAVAALVGALVAAPLVAPVAQAQEGTGDLESLLSETVVTTASKMAETGTAAPATSSTLTAEDIRRYGLRTLDEAIDFLSLGVVSANPLHSPDLSARGVTLQGDLGNHLLLLIDGHTTNEALQGSALFGRGLGVPIELVDRIEIILGPGSVLYGSSAMLGVINVVTKRAKDFRGAHVAVESEVPISYRAMLGYGGTFSLFGRAAELTFGAEIYDREGPDFRLGPQVVGISPYTGKPVRYRRDGVNDGTWGGLATRSHYARELAGYGQLRVGDLSLRLQALTFKRAAPYRSAAVHNASDFDDPETYNLDRAVRADLSYDRSLSQRVSLKLRLYGDAWDRQSFVNSSDLTVCRNPAVTTCRFETPELARWGGLEAQASFDWLRDGRYVTLAGVDARLRQAGQKQELFDLATGEVLRPTYAAVDTGDPLLGVYLQNTLTPAPWVSANVGARVDNDPAFDPVLSPRAAAIFTPWEGGALKLVYAEAFRAPSFRERFVQIPDWQLRAEELTPERVRSVEASFSQRLGAHRVFFGAFRSWWRDLIERYVFTDDERADLVGRGLLSLDATLGTVNQFRNVASIENYGWNAAVEGSFLDGQLLYAANATGAIARREDGAGRSSKLAIAPRLFGNARVAYDLRGRLPTLALAAHYMSRRIADRAYDGGFRPLPAAPPQLELRGTVSGPIPGVASLSYRLSANYAFSDEAPYVIGARQFTTAGEPAELAPVDVFRVMIGLQYDFGGGGAAR